MRIVICANAAWNLHNFRSGLIRALRERGNEVIAVAPHDARHGPMLERLGCRFEALPMDLKGTSPTRDALLTWRFMALLRRLRPDAFLGFTIKPNIYGSLASNLLGVPVINNVSGLGTAFLSEGWLAAVASTLYRLALRRSPTVFFQNPDDLALFAGRRLVRPEQAVQLPGSGVDLERFSAQAPQRRAVDEPVFLLVARLLRDKGVVEYADAARQLRARLPGAKFRLLGFLDAENRTAIPRETVQAWVQEGTVEYLGAADDVRPHIAAADCVVLPSYREGTPRSLLEAAAMARPLIATDVPGCRETVEEDINGFLCRARDADSLAAAMQRFAECDPEQRERMGRASRAKMEREYDERIVFAAYLDALAAISGQTR